MPTIRLPRRVRAFVYDPGQLRIPKGNGDISGRWMDNPFTIVMKLMDSLNVGGGDDDGDSGTRRNLRPATDADKAAIKEKYGRPIPPAWRDVKVDLDVPDGTPAVLVTGIDEAGRTQAIYNAEHLLRQASRKFNRVGQVFNTVDALDSGLADVGDDPAKAAARLMYLSGVRVGGGKQTGKVPAYGASTLMREHVTMQDDGSVRLNFTAKEGIPAEYTIDDPELVRYIGDVMSKPGQPTDKLFNTSAATIQKRSQAISGLPGMKNHDYRTLLANRIAIAEVSKRLPITSEAELKKVRDDVAKIVSSHLRNKPKQALDSYISPTIWETLRAGIEEQP